MENSDKILSGIAGALMISIICTVGVKNESAITALVVEYSILGAAVLLLMITQKNDVQQLNTSGNSLVNMGSNLLLILSKYAPFLFILFNIIYYIVITSIYFKNATSNNMSNYYYNFLYIATGLILAQIGLLIYPTFAKIKDAVSMGKIANIIKWLIILLGTINGIVVITLGIILKFYTTQG